MGELVIDVVETESCYRLSQYGQNLLVTCGCSSCKDRNQAPEQAKEMLDKIYK